MGIPLWDDMKTTVLLTVSYWENKISYFKRIWMEMYEPFLSAKLHAQSKNRDVKTDKMVSLSKSKSCVKYDHANWILPDFYELLPK